MVTIDIKDAKKTYKVQKSLLCTAAKYFRDALGGSWAERGSKPITLPDCDEETCQYFIYWLAYRKLPSSLANEDSPMDADGDDTGSDDTLNSCRLVKIWVFGDKYVMPQLQNATMTLLISNVRKNSLRVETTRLAFEMLPDSLVTKLLLEQQAYNYKASPLDPDSFEHLSDCPGLMYDFCHWVRKVCMGIDLGSGKVSPMLRDSAAWNVVEKEDAL
jgi:hypothetical protein